MKNFFMSLCLVLIAYGSAGFIKNGGKTAKMTHFVFALCVLCSLVSIIPTIDLSMPSFEKSDTAQFTNAELSGEVFKETVKNLLRSHSITFNKIDIISSKNDDGSITIDKIMVRGTSDPQKATEILKSNTGIEQIEVS